MAGDRFTTRGPQAQGVSTSLSFLSGTSVPRPFTLASSSGFSLLFVTCPLSFVCGIPEGLRCGADALQFWEASVGQH